MILLLLFCRHIGNWDAGDLLKSLMLDSFYQNNRRNKIYIYKDMCACSMYTEYGI